MAFDRKIKLAIVGTTGIPACYGGFETLAHHLVNQLRDEYSITVYCSSKFYPASKRIRFYNGAQLKYFPLNANGYQSIPYDFLSLIHALIFSEAIIMLGISGAMLIPFIKFFSNKPLIVNIDGQEWKRAKWNTPIRRFLRWSEGLAVNFADCVITDNAVIYDYVKKEYGKESTLIEYGADHVSRVPVTTSACMKYPFLNKPYFFTVCRIEPENNIHLILEAFAKSSKTLVIVGLWTHGDYGKKLKAKYSDHSNIHLLDPIYEQKELNILRSNCCCYVHGHSSGGTNPSLVEAMYLQLPVITYGVSYNRETTEYKAKYFSTQQELLELTESITEPELKKIGSELKKIADRRYMWHIISSKYRNMVEVAASKNYRPLEAFSLQFSTGSTENYYQVNEAETF